MEKEIELEDELDTIKPIREIAELNKKENRGDRFSMGFNKFNSSLKGGVKSGDLHLIVGETGHGKTSLGQTFTYHLCKQGIPCLWFSYETDIEDLNEKFLNMGLDDDYLAYSPLKNTSGDMYWIIDRIREAVKKYSCKAIFIDHIGKLTPRSITKTDNETLALTKISQELKGLARELDIVIFAFWHINKVRDNKIPDINDIYYSAGIAQECDGVFIIWRLKNKTAKSSIISNQDEAEDVYSDESRIKIVKSRPTGKTPVIKVKYIKDRFIELDEEHDLEDINHLI